MRSGRSHIVGTLSAWTFLVALVAGALLAPGCARDGKRAGGGASNGTGTPPSGAAAARATTDLIPRQVLFGNPDRAGVQISPDGRHVSFLAPREGVMNVFVAPVDAPGRAVPVTNDRTRGIPFYFWAFDSRHVLYGMDAGGDENWNIFSVAVDAPGEPRNLTPNPKVAAQVTGVSDRHPGEILVSINDRDPRFHDVHRINLSTGESTLVARNPGQIDGNMVGGMMADDDYRIRFAAATTPEGALVLYRPKAPAAPAPAEPDAPDAPCGNCDEPAGDEGKAGNDGGDADAVDANAEAAGDPVDAGDVPAPQAAPGDVEWELFDTIGPDDALTTNPLGFDKSGLVMYLSDSRGRDTAAFFALDLRTGEKRLLAQDPRADVGDVMIHPTEKTVQAVAFEYDRRHWQVLDDAIKPDFAYLETVADGEFNVLSRTLDDQTWIVGYMMDDGPVRYYRYDRAGRKAEFLFTNRKELEGRPLAKMHPVVIESRDELKLVSYLTLPAGSYRDYVVARGVTTSDGRKIPVAKFDLPVPRPAKPLPTVLLVHGGPWARDSWGLNGMHQWLANRGYAVLSVNFRGSTGFGKRFLNAGNKEWAGKMHDDLIDAVDWAVKQGVADEDKVAIMGGSYGGFATLVGLTFTPETFACGVDIVGPSRIVTLFETIPPYWVAGMNLFKQRVGDHTTEEGRKFLDSRSPLSYVDRIKRPLLIGQGANDPRVKQAEADQIVEAMKAKDLPVVYVLYKDEGHGFQRPENRLSFNAVTEQFLAAHLGGRAEPIGDDLAGSSIAVPEGAGSVAGLAEAMAQPQTQPAGGS